MSHAPHVHTHCTPDPSCFACVRFTINLKPLWCKLSASHPTKTALGGAPSKCVRSRKNHWRRANLSGYAIFLDHPSDSCCLHNVHGCT